METYTAQLLYVYHVGSAPLGDDRLVLSVFVPKGELKIFLLHAHQSKH